MGRATGVLAATLLLANLPAPAQAAPATAAPGATGATIVRGTAFPDPLTATLSFTGCQTLHGVSGEVPQPFIGRGPDTPPTGTRSLGFDLLGGNAAGALFMRPSMTGTTTAEVAVHSVAGASGVAYAGYQEPADGGTTRIWIGRASVATGAGWQRVDATRLSYTWTKRDLRTGVPLLAGPTTPATVASFATTHGGDGAGLYTLGFGCDGESFSLDTFRVGSAGAVRTYDLEGLATTTTIAGAHAVEATEETRLTSGVRDQSGAPVPGATTILEQRSTPGGAWSTVVDAHDVPVVVTAGTAAAVTPERTTTYRFRFVDRPLAEGSVSTPFVVTVTPKLTARFVPGERVVTGTIDPAVPGTLVTLWPSGRTTGTALARAEVRRDGSYELSVPPEAGGDLVVRLAATPGLQPATSDPVRVGALVDPGPETPTPSAPASTPASSPASPGRPENESDDEPAGEQEQDLEQPAHEPTEQPAEQPAEQSAEDPQQEQDQPVPGPAGTPASTEPTDAPTA